jgi:hypothetical protein
METGQSLCDVLKLFCIRIRPTVLGFTVTQMGQCTKATGLTVGLFKRNFSFSIFNFQINNTVTGRKNGLTVRATTADTLMAVKLVFKFLVSTFLFFNFC